MNAENINSFVHGAQSTLSAFCGESGKLGKLFVKQKPYAAMPVSVIIGIIGDLQGEVIYTMDTDCGMYLASKVMMGMSVLEMDDMAKSAISELANMISGNAASMLFSCGVKIDITTPTYVVDNDTSIFSSFINAEDKLLCVPMHLTSGQIFEMDLHLRS